MEYDEMRIEFRTPKKLKKGVPKRHRKSIELTITFRRDCDQIAEFIKKCLEDGFRDNGASAVIDFTPAGMVKRIEV